MEEREEFYTLKGYWQKDSVPLTPAMEDYLEMICRLGADSFPVRVKRLAEALHVKPSSVTKNIQALRTGGYIIAKRYGAIELTEKGREEGAYLLYRHDVLFRFLCFLNGTGNELRQTERIEHFVDRETVFNLERVMEKWAEK